MNLRDRSWNFVYRTGENHLLNDFYIPMLKCAKRYDRAVGFFSSSIFAASAKGISELVKRNGKMRLVIGHPLDHDEFDSISDGTKLRDLGIDPLKPLLDALNSSSADIKSYRLRLLAWMIACGNLEIRFALRKRGMYHEKIGVVEDESGEKLSFAGSANESLNAMEDLNAESISVYPSWEPVYQTHGVEYERAFELLWNNRQPYTRCVTIPSEDYEHIAQKAALLEAPNLEFELELETEAGSPDFDTSPSTKHTPQIPKLLHGHSFEIKQHQRAALEHWRANNYCGILKLATGAGKTITAIYGAVKLYQANSRLFVIVAVPYVELANQWVSVLKLFGINAHRCYESKTTWHDRFQSEVIAFRSQSIDFCCAVVVNATLSGSSFAKLIEQVPSSHLFFIGDECHHHGAMKIAEKLPLAQLRLGLSATPYESESDEVESPFPNDSRQRIAEYYGPIVFEYSLGDAINDDVLTPYNYQVYPAYLSQEEQEEFEYLSGEIARLIAGQLKNSKDRELFIAFCAKRSRLLGSASEKLLILKTLAAEIPSQVRAHTLFYCAEGFHFDEESNEDIRQVSRVSKVLSDSGWRTAQFTAIESREQRRGILDAFDRGDIQGLVSMRVLDEGIDIPACQRAFILASTRNRRQYVQRRGRILRKSPGKYSAEIIDFLVLPSREAEDQGASRRLKAAELDRVYDFLELAQNRSETLDKLEELGLHA